MCFQTIPVLSQPRSKNTSRRQHNHANLRPISTSSTTPLSFSVGLWNCQSAVNKADFISAFSLQSTLSILGLTETWIRPEDSATPAALSHNFSFSHTQRQVGRGGGTGLFISNNWKYSTHSPLGYHNSFESHAITVTDPIKFQIVVIYRPPGQILATFLEELDGLLSSFMFFVINNFLFSFFHKQHNIISKIKQNKTADTYSTSQSSIKREGEREGQQEHKSYSFK